MSCESPTAHGSQIGMLEPGRETCWVGVGERGEVCKWESVVCWCHLIIHSASDLLHVNGGENGGKY